MGKWYIYASTCNKLINLCRRLTTNSLLLLQNDLFVKCLVMSAWVLTLMELIDLMWDVVFPCFICSGAPKHFTKAIITSKVNGLSNDQWMQFHCLILKAEKKKIMFNGLGAETEFVPLRHEHRRQQLLQMLDSPFLIKVNKKRFYVF